MYNLRKPINAQIQWEKRINIGQIKRARTNKKHKMEVKWKDMSGRALNDDILLDRIDGE